MKWKLEWGVKGLEGMGEGGVEWMGMGVVMGVEEWGRDVRMMG